MVNPSFQPIQTFTVDDLSVKLYGNEMALAQDTASIVNQYLSKLLSHQEIATVVLATGNSQLQFLDAWVTDSPLDWSRIILFHLDEYLGISANHPASFRHYLQERVEKQVNPRQFHYLRGDTTQPLDECDRYTQLLRKQPIDLCLLGVGNNGHLAFNEPSVADFNDSHAVKLVRLESENHQQQVAQGHFPNLESVPNYAFTLTIPMICAAQKILCLAPGKHKAKVIEKMLQGRIHPDCPASILRKQAHATLFLDTESASLLQ